MGDFARNINWGTLERNSLSMPIYQAVILGIIQGLAEFLPISSSAHLALAPWLFGWKDQGLAFDIAMHFGTLVSVGIYFFKDWIQIIGQAFGLQWGSDEHLRSNPKILWYLIAASVPAGIAGLLFKKTVETTLRSAYVIGFMAIIVGLILLLAEFFGSKTKTINQITLKDGMFMGLAQAVALIPGTSRSGATIGMGLFRNLERSTAARFSFLMSTPVIAGAALKDFWDLYKQGGIAPDMRIPFLVGILVSGLVGCAVIAFFLKYLRRAGLAPFVIYRVIFGFSVLGLAIFRGFEG
jgi:undecaprenyl-diphosphatase